MLAEQHVDRIARGTSANSDGDDLASVAQISERIREFERSGNPAVLWPGLAERDRVAAAGEIERVTRAVLGRETGIVLDPASRHAEYALAVAGHTTGMGPLLGRWIDDGSVSAAPGAGGRFARSLEHARRRAERIERGTLPALDALRARGIEPIALKGFHTARSYFPEPGVRRMSDVDLLVPRDRIADAEAALSAVGFRPTTPAERPYKRDWIGPGVDPGCYSLELDDERSRWTLELHTSIERVFQPGAVTTLGVTREDLVSIDIGGRDVHVLGQPLLFLTLACHCSNELDASRLLRLVELVFVVRRDVADGRLDWDALAARLRATRSARFIFPALALVEMLAPHTIDPRVLAAARRDSTRAARHTVPRLVPAGGSPDQRGVARQLMWTRGGTGLLQRLGRTLWPTSFRTTRGVVAGWSARIRRLRSGALSVAAPDERGA